jgi:uncharacterized protein (DUF488 family)
MPEPYPGLDPEGRQPAVVLYTLGYEKRTIEEFIEILRRAKIDTLIDVRDVPWSHKRDFAKSKLDAHLASAGIRYVHAGFAGNPKRLRQQGGTTDELLALYEHHLDDHPEIVDRFRELVAELDDEGDRACIMCFERDPRECHRSVLAARWKGRRRGVSVEDLGTGPNAV